MEKIVSETDLRNAILHLEVKQAAEEIMLKKQFYHAVDSVRPINLIKSTFKEAVASRDLKNNIINTSVGLTTGYLAKIVFAGALKTPLAKLLGTALMFGITNIVARNPETVKSLGKGVIKMIRGKYSKRMHAVERIEPRQITSTRLP
jgi:hypothetical protein